MGKTIYRIFVVGKNFKSTIETNLLIDITNESTEHGCLNQYKLYRENISLIEIVIIEFCFSGILRTIKS